jgi:glycosyltransferase involved in cell wall biosynthesis
VRQHGKPIRVTVIGDGDGFAACREQVRRHGLQDVVQLLGWQDHLVVVDYAAQANVGLVPHHVTSHSNTTVPNKLFDFMASGIPVLASDTRPVSRILAETGAGLVYRDWDAESFSDALALLADPARRQALGESGQRAVRERFNWERDSTCLVEDVVRTVDRYRHDRAHRR